MNDRPDQFATTQPIKKSPRAFTLVELLVVIAILGGLAALVVPAVKSGLSSAKSVQSVSNLKQIGGLVENYAAENNNRLPYAAVWLRLFRGELVFFSRSLAEATVPGFAYEVAPCTRDRPLPPIFYDPCLAGDSRKQHTMGAFAVNRSIVTDTWTDNPLEVGYTPCTSLLSISRPSQKVIFCSIGPGDAQYCGGWLLTGAEFVANGMSNNGYPDPRNSGGAASLFADGHVERLDVKNMDEATRRKYFTPDP